MRRLAEHAADAAGRGADFADGVAELAERVSKAEDAAATYSKPAEDVDLDDPRVVAALEALSAQLEKQKERARLNDSSDSFYLVGKCFSAADVSRCHPCTARSAIELLCDRRGTDTRTSVPLERQPSRNSPSNSLPPSTERTPKALRIAGLDWLYVPPWHRPATLQAQSS